MLIAAALLLSLVPLQPLSVAHAAVTETSAERLGGADRYATAAAVAEAYLEQISLRPDRVEASTVILTSGSDRHLGYALPAVTLAAAHDSPILLTEPHRLHPAVAAFIEAHAISRVFILGGTSVVSSAVETSVRGLGDVEVTRLAGADVYSTAIAVAGLVGPIPGSPGEHGSRGRTVLLANGETLADALVAGPLGYRGEHPVLLTPGDVLDRRLSQYLDDSDTEHVIILGGPAAVSAAMEAALEAKGITVTRLAGFNRHDTALTVLKHLLGTTRPHNCFDGSQIGLAIDRKAPDAISSGPLLGERCAPLLLVRTDSVPPEVNEYLASADARLGSDSGLLSITVLGGTAAVSNDTVDSFRIRAQQGEPFAAKVSATAGASSFAVTFSEDVKEDEVTKRERYIVNNVALVRVEPGAEPPATGRVYTEISVVGRVVTVELTEPLKVGDTITVVGETGTAEGRSNIALDENLPALESVFYRVPRAAVVRDTTGPQIQIVAIADKYEFVVLVTESALRRGDRLRNDVIYRGKPVHELTVVGADGKPKEVTFEASADDCSRKPEDPSPRVGLLPDEAKKIGEECYEDPATLGANRRYTASVTDALKAGDVITVAKGALHDQRRNPSRLTRYTVTEHADEKQFKVAQAAVGTARHTKQASLLISNARESDKSLRIIAKSTGVAAGAAGNSWVVYPYVDPDRREPAESKIEVGVDTVHRRISYTIVDGKITLANLAAALNRNSTFDSNFSASVVTSTDDAISINGASGGRLSGGESKVGVRVRFTDHVESVSLVEGEKDPLCGEDDPGFDKLFCTSQPTPEAFKSSHLLASLFLDGRSANHHNLVVRCQRRGPVVYLEYNAADDARVPLPGTPVRVPADVVKNHNKAPNLVQRVFNLRSDPAIPSQFGFEDSKLSEVAALDVGCDKLSS